MAVINGYAGGSLPGSQYLDRWKITWLPEALFAFGCALPMIVNFGLWGCIAIPFSYMFLQSGTWIILPWRDKGVRNTTRGATLKPISDWIANKLNFDFDSVQYAATYAAVKGFLITLPLGGFGALYMPLSYELGYRLGHNKWSEMAFGAFTGLNIWILTEIL